MSLTQPFTLSQSALRDKKTLKTRSPRIFGLRKFEEIVVEATRESLKESTHLPQEENSDRKYLRREQRIDGESPWT